MRADRGRWHFGVLAAGGTGHLNPFLALAQELTARRHRVTFFGSPKGEPLVRQAGFNFVSLATSSGNRRVLAGRLGLRAEIAWLRSRVQTMRADIAMYLAETPRAVAAAGVNVLLVDEIAVAGPTVAQMLNVPWIIVSTSIPHRFGWSSISWLTGYRSSASAISWLQSIFLELSVFRMSGPVRRAVDAFRADSGFGPTREIHQDYPCLVHIAQLPRCLDFPRRTIAGDFCYAGPFVNRARPSEAFPWERLDGRPLIYASVGTTSHAQPALLRMIAEACSTLDAQLVMSLGNRFAPDELADLPGNPVVVRYAPQLDVLERADVVITHAGLNTALEALAAGKPMVAIPLAFDQPAVAARLRQLGVAETLPVMRLSPERIRSAVQRVLLQRSHAQAAEQMQSALCALNGASRAATAMEQALDRHLFDQQLAPSGDATCNHTLSHASRASEPSRRTASLSPQ